MAERASLAQLHDLALPAPPSAWPPAPFALALLGLLALGLLWLAWRGWRRWRGAAYRRAALAELRALEAALPAAPQRLAELPRLLKATALAAWPRDQVAALSGAQWLAFLRASAAGCEPPAALAELALWPTARLVALPAAERARLLRAARQWIRLHVRP